MNTTGYAGAFTPVVEEIIRAVACRNGNRVCHLFSGQSKLGDTRIDIDREEATNREDVLEFIARDTRIWDFVILDPPYEIQRKAKLYQYGKTSSAAADVILRRKLSLWFRKHALNIMWLDLCAPIFPGFRRKKLWLLFPGGFHSVRILSWLEKSKQQNLDF